MFYNLGPGGDGTVNPNWALYPQRALVIGNSNNEVVSSGATPLMPAEHMSPSTYNMWNRIHFGHEPIPSNLGTREWLKRLYASGGNIEASDLIGVVTLPRLAILRGVMLQVNTANAGVIFDVVSMATGEALLTGIDASATGVYYVDVSGFVVAMDSNDSLALRVTAWPSIDTENVDPCGVYGPCDDLTLCITMNAFIWAPVSAEFCASDPCFGVNSRPVLALGVEVDPREQPVVSEAEVNAEVDTANSTASLADGVLTVTARDAMGNAVDETTIHFVPTGDVTVSPAAAMTDSSGVASTVVTPGANGGTVVSHVGTTSGPIIATTTVSP